jgi:hypothetical protein
MSKKINSSDLITESTLHEILLNMDARLKHIEDIESDNREIIIKLVKQGNSIVKFLSKIDIEDVTDEFEDITSPPIPDRSSRMGELRELVDEFMERDNDLKEFEEELEKHKEELTPGTIGES